MGNPTFLEKAAAASLARSRSSEEAVPLGRLQELCAASPPPPSFLQAVRRDPGGSVRIIAEVKMASPSRGVLSSRLDAGELAAAYERGGASAVSVLTEPDFFRGSLDHLEEAGRCCRLPLLRKDFIVSEYQVWESRARGASAVLLLAALHPARRLHVLLGLCRHLGMEALVEVSSGEELKSALEGGAAIIGANNRDLRTLRVDMRSSLRLLEKVPPGLVKVSESGYRRREQVIQAERQGIDAVLVGECLSASADPLLSLLRLRGQVEEAMEGCVSRGEGGLRPCS
jgi:indole-3-glycerol phosphate synthase